MNPIHWKFEGTLSSFTTPKEKFDITVAKMRHAMNIHPEHKIEILNATESNPNSTSSSNGARNSKRSSAVSSPAKPAEPQSETPELRDLPDILDIDSDGSIPF